jgi:hypothetical protein
MSTLRSSLVVAFVLMLLPPAAHAHDVRGTAVFLTVGERAVDAELQLPLSDLALALQRPIADGRGVLDGNQAEPLLAYVRGHLHGYTCAGAPMTVAVTSAELQRIDDADVLVVRARLAAPADESARYLLLAYDGIVERVMNHNVYVFVRRDLANGVVGDRPELVGLLHYQQRTLIVDRTGGSLWRGLGAMVGLGVHHIAGGTDHLLFLLMLLLPAPLVAARRRWHHPAPLGASVAAVIRIVTAFTIGHSLTLIVAALRGAELPARPVEVAIAVSILVSAVHAWRPLFAGKEALVAGAFGLVHGLAFASALTAYGFDGGSLAIAVLGFNLGVEAMQLAVVALIMPWLMLASRRPAHRLLRVAGATLGAVAAAGLITERAFGLVTPIPTAVEWLAAHALWVAMALAAFALAAHWSGTRGPRPAASARQPAPT